MTKDFNIDDAVLAAYLAKELDRDAIDCVHEWLNQSVANRDYFEAMKKTWENTGESELKTVSVNTDLAWLSVKKQISSETPVVQMQSKFNVKWIGIAASIVILLGIGSFWLMQDEAVSPVELTAKNQVLTDELPDGTHITLNANSSLSYPDSFGDERRVWLTGEAFFEVKRDEKKPFIVDLKDEAYVKVLGTSFDIRSDEEMEMITVYVASGTVEFGNEKEKVILEKGEIGEMDMATGHVVKKTDETPGFEELFWMDRSLNFDGLPLQQVIDILNTIYDGSVRLECLEKANEPIKSSHRNESLEEILNVIAEVHGLKIDKKEENSYTLNCND